MLALLILSDSWLNDHITVDIIIFCFGPVWLHSTSLPCRNLVTFIICRPHHGLATYLPLFKWRILHTSTFPYVKKFICHIKVNTQAFQQIYLSHKLIYIVYFATHGSVKERDLSFLHKMLNFQRLARIFCGNKFWYKYFYLRLSTLGQKHISG